MAVGVEGYGGLAEPGLRGTEADLRGIGSGWEGEGKEVMAMGREGMDEGGIFEGFGMNEEGRRALGRGEPAVYRRRFLGTVRLRRCPRPMSLSPFPVTVPVIMSGWTRPHASFGFRFTSSTGPVDVVISFDLSFPVPRLAACPAFRA